MVANGMEKYMDKFELSPGKTINFYSLKKLREDGNEKISHLPFSIRVVLESLVRNFDGKLITEEDVKALSEWNPKNPGDKDIPFKVSRILMQDFTGVPAVVDLAAMREYLIKSGKKDTLIQPDVPVDLIIDHSVQVDAFNTVNAIEINQEKEIGRNKERYLLLKWAGQAFNGFRVFPPSAGICHQINLEYLATCVSTSSSDGQTYAFPDTMVGTDSHTTMVNGLGIVGFGVGGIEAEAALLNQPVSFTTPNVVGVHLKGKLNDGITAADFALTLTRLLREKNVVGAFVEFFGDGLKSLSLQDRATLSNMCPEYGATIAIFPPDEETLKYLKMTGRSQEQISLIREYYTRQEMFNIDYGKVEYSDILEVDLSSIRPSVSGPSQPKQQMPLEEIGKNFMEIFIDKKESAESPNIEDTTRWSEESAKANGKAQERPAEVKEGLKSAKIKYEDGHEVTLSDGDIVISSITSCTNTSNPSAMVGAGLLAKKAVEHGLKVDNRKVKTSFAPGSRVVSDYIKKAGLDTYLEKLGYGLVGYGCITCIGNSGPLIDKQSEAINSNNLAVASVLSGNRNYESRINRDIRANYLMSPPLLIAFGIAGTVLKDLTKEPLAKNDKGEDVYLRDIWPKQEEINEIVNKVLSESMYEKEYGNNIFNVNPYWNKLPAPSGTSYKWDGESTYIRLPPFFDELDKPEKIDSIKDATVLAVFGDSISTDHISPAGAIGVDSPAGKYLISLGVEPKDFNTYGTRRGNHEVMMRGTFANNRIKNLMVPGKEGGFTVIYPENKTTTIYEAAMEYKKRKVPLIVIAGAEYGSGSSRDWAAKGPALLGVKAIIAKSFERIHRSNLIGMGIVPLQFKSGEDASSLRIDHSKPISVEFTGSVSPRSTAKLHYSKIGGEEATADLTIRIDSPIELEYVKSGGILNYVLKNILKNN